MSRFHYQQLARPILDSYLEEALEEWGVTTLEIDTRSSEGITPLHVACIRGSEEEVHILLMAGADPNVRDVQGQTPLDAAMYGSNWPIITLLRKHGVIPGGT